MTLRAIATSRCHGTLQHVCERLEDLPDEQLERTFRTNMFSQFHPLAVEAVDAEWPQGEWRRSWADLDAANSRQPLC